MMISTMTHYCLLAKHNFFVVLNHCPPYVPDCNMKILRAYSVLCLWWSPFMRAGQSKNGTHQFCQTENYFRPNWPNPGRMTNLLIGSALSWRNKCIIFVDWPIRAGWPVLTICKHPYSSISPSSLSMHLCELPSPSSSTSLCLLFQVWYQ